MPSLITLRRAPGAAPYLLDAVPHAYEEAGKQQFRAMPGIRWVRDALAPNGRGYYRGPAEAIEIVAATLESASVVRVRRDGEATAAVTPAGEIPNASLLRGYQLDGVGWLRAQLRGSGAALLADEMGLGKTVQAIAAADAVFDAAASRLVVCPAIVAPKWQREIARWSTCADAWEVLSHDAFRRRATAGGVSPRDVLVADEIHYWSNPKSKRTIAAVRWCETKRPAAIIGLTGTPLNARVRDLWQPLDILWPGRFGSWWDFTRRYCDGKNVEVRAPDGSPVIGRDGQPLVVWSSEGHSREGELSARLSHCMLRRLKVDVLTELPALTRECIDVEIPRKALRDLQRAAVALSRDDLRVVGGASVSTLLSNIESYKIDAACELASEIITAGSKPLILTLRRDTAHQIGTRLGAACVTGDDSAARREAVLQGAPVGVATLDSVTVGIDLVGYDCIIMCGLDWLPSKMLQGEARIHRIGQTKGVIIYYLVGRHTLDEVVRERVIDRLDVIAAALGGDSSGGMSSDLGGGSEEDLIAAIVAAAREAA